MGVHGPIGRVAIPMRRGREMTQTQMTFVVANVISI